MGTFTLVDYIFLAFFFFSTLLGLSRGFFKELISLVSILFALIITIKFTGPVANWLNASNGAQDVVLAVSTFFGVHVGTQLTLFTIGLTVLVLFVGVYSVGEAMNAYGLFEMLVGPGVISLTYRILGGIIGFVRGYIFNLILIIFIGFSPIGTWSIWKQSTLLPKLQPNANTLANLIAQGTTTTAP